MWEDIRTPSGKLLFRINFVDSLIESAKDGWIILFNFKTQQIITKHKQN